MSTKRSWLSCKLTCVSRWQVRNQSWYWKPNESTNSTFTRAVLSTLKSLSKANVVHFSCVSSKTQTDLLCRGVTMCSLWVQSSILCLLRSSISTDMLLATTSRSYPQMPKSLKSSSTLGSIACLVQVFELAMALKKIHLVATTLYWAWAANEKSINLPYRKN